MRNKLMGLAAVLTAVVVPGLAWASNQEVADQIKQNLQNSGQLSHYKIGVMYQDGVASLSGRVTSQEQMNAALKVVYQTPGVTRIANNLSIAARDADQKGKLPLGEAQPKSEPRPPESTIAKSDNPLRDGDGSSYYSKRGTVRQTAEQVPSSYSFARARTVSAEEMAAEPQQVAPQMARPMSQGQQRVAMRSADPRENAVTGGAPLPMYPAGSAAGAAPVRYDQPHMPRYAWPSYAPYPNYAAVSYPKQYSPMAWPYIGPFYPYPQVPMGWRKVSMEWSDGWWFLDFKDQPASCWQR